MNEVIWEVEKQFQPLFKFATTAIALTNKGGIFIQSNRAFQELSGYTEEELQNLTFSELIHGEEQAESCRVFEEIFSGKGTHFVRKYRYLRKDGCFVRGDISVNVVCDSRGCPQYALITILNINDVCEELRLCKEAHLDLQNAYAQLEKQLFEETAERIKANTHLNQQIMNREKVEATFKTQKAFLQTLINLYPGTIFAQDSFAVVTDASTLEAMESELQQAKEQLRAVLDAMPGFVAWINSEGKYLGVNQYMADCFNLSPDDFVEQKLSFLENSSELADFMAQFIENSEQTSSQEVEIQVSGLTHNYLIIAQKYHKNSLAVIVGIDITKRKLAETKIQISLREKEILLQEVHHRVKNNLQVISSLLDLQSQEIEEQATLELFQESQNRVKSMALVHEKLYQSEDFARINFAEYTESLTSYLFKAYDLMAGNITLELNIDNEATLAIDTAIPCGLIINELVSNALKYAFRDRQSGTVKLTLYCEPDNYLTLIIQDDGVGFPQMWDIKSAKTLGIQLVKILTKQLKGTIELDKSQGSKFIIRFAEVSDSKAGLHDRKSKNFDCRR
jgi:PAS domain S-box-containing protein